MLECLPVCVLGLDRANRIAYANPAAESLFGYHTGELAGARVESVVPDFSGPHGRTRRQAVRADPAALDSLIARRKGGGEFLVDLSFGQRQAGHKPLTYVFVTDLTPRVQLADSLAALEDERRRLSYELHDQLGQKLAHLTFELQRLKDAVPSELAELRQESELACRRAAALADEVHQLSHKLYPPVLEKLGLSLALRSHCAELARCRALRVHLVERGVPKDLPLEAALCLYRVAQEALQNVIKHAGVDKARLRITGDDRAVSLVVEDSGAGFDVEAVRGSSSGLGILTMQERIRALHGRFSIKSSPGKGVRLEITVPRSGADHETPSPDSRR